MPRPPHRCHIVKFCRGIDGHGQSQLTSFLLFFSSNSRAPYQLHNEDIVNHLYHAGFQTGVSTTSRPLQKNDDLIEPHPRGQNYADTVLVSTYGICPLVLV